MMLVMNLKAGDIFRSELYGLLEITWTGKARNAWKGWQRIQAKVLEKGDHAFPGEITLRRTDEVSEFSRSAR